MNISPELIVAVLRTSPTPEEAADLLEEYGRRRIAVEARHQRRLQIQEQARKDVCELMAQRICVHEFLKTNHDPSGGSDCDRECLICGESL